MILVCPECSTNYALPTGLPDGGTTVRCTSCTHVWHATDADLKEIEEPAPVEETASDDEPAEEDIPAVSPFDTDPLEEIDFNEIEDEEAVVDEENSQGDIDSLFDEISSEEDTEEDQSQEDIDSLFDEEMSEPDEENSQDDIDGLFDEAAPDEEDENSQDDVDGLFDEPAVAAQPPPTAAPAAEPEPAAEVNEDPFEVMEARGEALSVSQESEPVKRLPFWKQMDQQVMIGWCCYLLVVGLIATFIIFARVPIVRNVPAMAGIYSALGLGVNVRGVMFTNVQQRWETDNETLQLRVDGEIANLTGKYQAVPSLVFTALSDESREVFRWVVNVRRKPLLPGEKSTFVARLPAPPEYAKHLLIRFD